MIRKLLVILVLGGSVSVGVERAHAHIKLTKPASWIQENSTGDPQKSGPCGPAAGQGVETNEVTTYTAGEEITVEWTETVNHEGHFRIALAKDRSELMDPKITGQCQSAEIMDPPQLPVLADGLFAVKTDDGKRMFSQKLKLPDGFTCDKCTLQVLQFMTPHPAPCLYYHCANVKIVAAGSAAGSGGSNALVAPPPAGATGGRPIAGGSAAGSSGAAGTPGAAGKASAGMSASAGRSAAVGGSGAAVGGSPSGSSGTGTNAGQTAPKSSSGGCAVSDSQRGPTGTALVWLLTLGTLARRRRVRVGSAQTSAC